MHRKKKLRLMSGWGQKRKGSQRAYSIRITPKSRHRRCALALLICANSCREQMQQNACGGPALFDHLISKGEQLRGNFEAERLSGGQIDDQIKLGRLEHRQVGGLLSFENAAGVTASLLERIS